ncbi:MAG: hypothetical protein AAGD25_32845 [Cyanobacteria bacterium P01_F01_bin.150]
MAASCFQCLKGHNTSLQLFKSFKDFVMKAIALEQPAAVESLQEATGMAIAANNTLQLVAQNSQQVQVPSASCSSQTNIF